jgi:hypothetical protein
MPPIRICKTLILITGKKVSAIIKDVPYFPLTWSFCTVQISQSIMVAKTLLTSISFALALVGATSGFKSSGTNSSNIVTWDKYSLKINDQRSFLFSGEFHVSLSNKECFKLPKPQD